MKGRWAAGITPRNFSWILKDQLAVSERPGGFAPHHRRVRRQEEILWLNAHGFTRVVSLLPSNHNLHAYDELHIPASHFGLPTHGDARPALLDLYRSMWGWFHDGERILVHQEELSDQVAGVVAGFLCWSGLLSEPPRAVSAVEQLLRRQMGSAGRSLVAVAADLPPGPPWASRPTYGETPVGDDHGSPETGHPSTGHPSTGHPSRDRSGAADRPVPEAPGERPLALLETASGNPGPSGGAAVDAPTPSGRPAKARARATKTPGSPTETPGSPTETPGSPTETGPRPRRAAKANGAEAGETPGPARPGRAR